VDVMERLHSMLRWELMSDGNEIWIERPAVMKNGGFNIDVAYIALPLRKDSTANKIHTNDHYAPLKHEACKRYTNFILPCWRPHTST
jgi:hypothetical protein